MARRKPLPNANDYIAGGNVFKSEGHPLHKFEGVKRISVKCQRVENRPLSEFDELTTGWTTAYPQGYREYLTPCDNSTCQGGGFPIHEIVRDMITKKESRREVPTIICAGNEKMGRSQFRRCLHHAGPVQFEVEYEAPSSTPVA